MRSLLAALLSLSLLTPHVVAAQGFWQEIRTPGLRTYRVAIREARTALDGNEPLEAATAARRAIQAQPEGGEGHRLLGAALARQNDLAGAEASFQRAWELAPELFDAHANAETAAIALIAGRAYLLAANILQRAVRAMPNSALRKRLTRRLTIALLAAGPEHLDRALAILREAQRAGPPDHHLVAALGVALYRRGQRDAALRLVREIDSGRGRLTWLQEPGLPPTELAWRQAVFREARGDLPGARELWLRAQVGPWYEAATEALERLGVE